MASSIFELVAMNMVSSLQNITTANGYEIQPLVRRYGSDKNPTSKTVSGDNDYTIEIELQQGTIESPPTVNTTGSNFTMNFMLLCFIVQPQSTTTATDTIMNQIYSGVVKALMADAQRGFFTDTTNPLAIDTRVGDATPFSKGNADYEGVAIPATVQVRTAQFDPYNQ